MIINELDNGKVITQVYMLSELSYYEKSKLCAYRQIQSPQRRKSLFFQAVSLERNEFMDFVSRSLANRQEHTYPRLNSGTFLGWQNI